MSSDTLQTPAKGTGIQIRALAALDYSVLQQCMHCGMCLSACPTFALTGRERHSPRGRIALLRAVADGEQPFNRAIAEEMSHCLGCLACTSACPAGVDYGTMVETARAEAERLRLLDTRRRRFLRWLAMRVLFTSPRLMRFSGRLLWAWQFFGGQRLFRSLGLNRLLPVWLREVEPLTPSVRRHFTPELVAPVEVPVLGKPRRRVLVLSGCMQDLLFSEINRATVDVLLENGCEVVTPPLQSCCGSLHAHNGDPETARMLARRQLEENDPAAFDAIISNAGGCGSHLAHYGPLLRDDTRYAARAALWSEKLRDIHAFLVEIGFRPPGVSGLAPGQRLTYHESCHLSHGQKVSAQPRAVLRSLPDTEFVECPEANWCCGSAGIYNLLEPEVAGQLQERKVAHLQSTHAGIIALANPGCHLQVENGLRAAGHTGVRVVHPVVLLAEAYRAERQA